MGNKYSFKISPLLVFLLCLGLYFGCWQHVLFGVLAAVLHELGHFLFLCISKKTPKKLSLTPFGAVMEARTLSYTEELLCTLCGPLTNLLCFIAFYNVQSVFASISLALAMYNLQPIFPLDGGRIVRTILLFYLDEPRARKIVFCLSFGFSLLVMFAAVWLCIVLQSSVWPVLVVVLILLKLDADARQEWH